MSRVDREKSKLIRVLRWFDKVGDALVGECELKDIELKLLQDIFDQPSDDPMYYSYPVSQIHVRLIQQYCEQHEIDLSKFDYFVDCYTEKS